jgi:hypothetical protein
MLATTPSLTTIPLLDTGKGTDFSWMFYGSKLTNLPALNTSSGINFTSMFEASTLLQTIPTLNASAGTNFTDIFTGVTALTQGVMSGARYSLNYTSTQLGATALRNVFAGLGTAAGAQTINITGTPGQASLTGADYAIATGKGWTVIPAYIPPVETPDTFCSASAIATLTNPIADLIYWDWWDGNSSYLANSTGTAVVAIVAPSETVLTTAEITAVDGNAQPGLVYFNEETGFLFVADTNGDLQAPTSDRSVADTASVEASAKAGEVYFNTTTGDVFYCPIDGTLDNPADPSSTCLTQ